MTHVNIARRYLGDLWSQGRLEEGPELVAPSCSVRDPLFGDCVGLEALDAHVRELRRAFPDLTWTIDEVIADAGPQLALTWSARGTHRRPFAGIPATGHSIELTGLLLLRFEGEKLIAITARWNPQELCHQLLARSAAPSPPRPSRRARGTTPAISAEQSELDAQWEL